ncbi:MAG: DUF2610 domain-containing protein [Chitinophagaceae bacterium]|nr:DUF2610 domain-containing protein [Chitinophagaceae bacterium]
MRAKLKVILFLLLAGNTALAQTPQERLTKYISDGYACLARKNFDCARSYCNLAEGTAKNHALFNGEVLTLKTKIANEKARYDVEKAFGNTSPLAQSQAGTGDARQAVAAAPSLKSKPVSNFVFPAGYPSSGNISNQGLLKDLRTLVDELKQTELNKPVSKEAEFIRHYETRLYGVDHRYQAELLYDSTLRIITKGGNIPSMAIYVHLRSVMYHVWDLIDERAWNKAADEQIRTKIQQTIKLLSRKQMKSAMELYALSGFENLLSRYYDILKNDKKGYNHTLNSVEFARQALHLSSDNAYLLRNLFNSMNNLRYIPDSLFSLNEKTYLLSLKCELGNEMKRLPEEWSDLFITSAYSCAADASNSLIKESRYEEAINRLKEEAVYVEQLKSRLGSTEHISFQLSDLYNNLCEIYKFYKKDSVELKKYTALSLVNFKSFLEGKITSQRLLDRLEGVFDELALSMEVCYGKEERLTEYKNLVRAVERSENDFVKFKNIAYVYTICNNLLSEQLLNRKTADDTANAQVYLLKAQGLFRQADFLKYYNVFSEDYSKFCSIFGRALQIYIQQQNLVQARNTYADMQTIFGPVMKKYPFDFYHNQYMFIAAMSYGRFLYEKGKFQEALAPLNIASFEGFKEGTELLIAIYESGARPDTAKANAMRLRTTYQAKGMKKFTVPVICGNVKAPFDFYVSDRAIGHPYKGIADQAEWLATARGCKVPDEVLTSFVKLQKIAWDNNVSFQELTVYALGEANKEKSKKEGSEPTDAEEEGDEASVNTLKISYGANKGNIPAFIEDKNRQQLLKILGYCLDDSLHQDAALVSKAILDQRDDAATRDSISLQYLLHTLDDHFEELFLSNQDRIKEFRTYFRLKDTDSLFNNVFRRLHYYNLVQLDLKYLDGQPADSATVKKQTSQHYNSLAWYCMLTKRFDNVLYYLRRSIRYDDENLYPYTNFPHGLLLTGEYEEAKELYLKLKDQPFDPESGIATFKDAFLNDFRDFEKEGILNDDCRKIIALLNENK